MSTVGDGYEWRYLPTGKLTHALGRPTDAVAMCGEGTLPSSRWRGTGSQDEYDRAAVLPRCRRCLRHIAG